MHTKLIGENVRDDVSRRGLAHRARDRDDAKVSLPPNMPRQCSQGSGCVRNPHEGWACLVLDIEPSVDQGATCALGEGPCYMIVAVKPISFEGDETLAASERSRIGADTGTDERGGSVVWRNDFSPEVPG